MLYELQIWNILKWRLIESEEWY